MKHTLYILLLFISLGLNAQIGNSNQGISNTIGSGRVGIRYISGGLPASLKAKLLFLGEYSDISGGEMPNQLGTDYLTVAGDAGSETYQCPNTFEYKQADEDFVWFVPFFTGNTVTTSNMVSYDFTRTLVKYANTSPYSISIIAILKAGETLTSNETDIIHSYFELSVYWSGVWNDNGYVKDNRVSEQSIFSDLYAILNDGNTVGWYLAADTSTITYNESGLVTAWNDKLGTNNLLQADVDKAPILYGDTVVTFGGVDEYLKTNTFTFTRPESVYILIKQITWTGNDTFFDGFNLLTATVLQAGTSPQIQMYSAVGSALSSGLALDTWGVIRLVFKTPNGIFIVNDDAPIIRSCNGGEMSGITLGGRPNGANPANISVKEAIYRQGEDSEADKLVIYNYLKSKL